MQYIHKERMHSKKEMIIFTSDLFKLQMGTFAQPIAKCGNFVTENTFTDNDYCTNACPAVVFWNYSFISL